MLRIQLVQIPNQMKNWCFAQLKKTIIFWKLFAVINVCSFSWFTEHRVDVIIMFWIGTTEILKFTRLVYIWKFYNYRLLVINFRISELWQNSVTIFLTINFAREICGCYAVRVTRQLPYWVLKSLQYQYDLLSS